MQKEIMNNNMLSAKKRQATIIMDEKPMVTKVLLGTLPHL